MVSDLTGEWRTLHNEELYALYLQQIFFRVIISRKMSRAGHVARMGERRGPCRVLVVGTEGTMSTWMT